MHLQYKNVILGSLMLKRIRVKYVFGPSTLVKIRISPSLKL